MQLDILAFGVHPDDVELSCSGTILASIHQGKKVGIVDLTRGELGTRGSAEIRDKEAADAAKILGVHHRENLRMADGFFTHSEENIKKIIVVLRKFRPSVILANAVEDRHPDHGRSAKLLADAAFLAGLQKIETFDENGNPQKAFRPTQVFHYIQDRVLMPDFVFDVTPFYEKKMESIRAYTTQFYSADSNEPSTYISSPQFLETVKGRDMMMGKKIGVLYGEGFITEKTVGIQDFNHIIQITT
ncbi:bacillithiol biosynthesis deacetylase BshB1 [Sediminibacterium sp. TEGAF015]|uniref:bacillithiol biosynthesis deacetylase BshB1 n=1 Tax=Sediminibacterium sp. TEGAF015 TaxID=575378 RepID=UPI0022050080|nr:bacillithiol biosynthesis deacetylase BshB1 [Sediminibacterium sp. TEGAF015]BDQ11431.1 bacillithiol biosynthesis deacetylase BshB1 [Sediminibacterium sp. TEGAF015]